MQDITRENLQYELSEEDAFSLKITADRYLLKDPERIPKKDDAVTIELEVKDKNTAGYNTVKEVAIVDSYFPDTDEVGVTIFSGVDRGKKETVPRSHVDVLQENGLTALKKRIGKALGGGDKKLEREIEERTMDKIVFGGRILAGAGTKEQLTYFNCYVAPRIHDSRGGLADHRKLVMEIMSRGGGVGTDGSTLRPAKTKVHGVRGRSSGSISWLDDLSRLTHLVEQGGSRRGAQMITLSDFHPDLIKFITAKAQKPLSADMTINGKKQTIEFGYRGNETLSGANISVLISEDFMEAYKNDEDWDLVFPDVANYDKEQMAIYDEEWVKIANPYDFREKTGLPIKKYATIPARDIMNLISVAMHGSAEPAPIFMGRANKMSNSWYFNPLISTNPCGEQPLAPWSVCNLGHVNIAKHMEWNGLTGRFELDFWELKKTTEVLTRALDNVIDATPYYFQENEDNQKKERRLGLGTMGIDEALKLAGLDYGTKGGREFAEFVFETVTVTAYRTSIEMAKEKGSFPAFDADKFLKSGFMKFLGEKYPEIIWGIKEYGIRNVTLVTQAPTGTTGTLAQTSTGIEPFFSGEFFRASRIGFTKQIAPVIKRMESAGMDTSNLKYAMDYSAKQHIDFQAVAQKWCDSAISKTINAPKSTTVEDLHDIIEYAYNNGLKGFTVYVDGSRELQVLTTGEDEETRSDLLYGSYEVRNAQGKGEVKLGFKESGELAQVIIDIETLTSTTEEQAKETIAHLVKTAMNAHGSSDCPECGGELVFTEGCFKCEACSYSKCG